MLPLSQTLSQKPIYFYHMNLITSQSAPKLNKQWKVSTAFASLRSSIARTTSRALHFIWPKRFAFECATIQRSLKYHKTMLFRVSTTNCYNAWNHVTSHSWEIAIFATVWANSSTLPPLLLPPPPLPLFTPLLLVHIPLVLIFFTSRLFIFVS